METLREEEVLRLEEALLKKMEERLTPLMEQAARDAARMAMQRLRLWQRLHWLQTTFQDSYLSLGITND